MCSADVSTVAEPEGEPGEEKEADFYAFDQFLEAGCDVLVAMALTHADVSPSALRELVLHGCPLDAAIAILL